MSAENYPFGIDVHSLLIHDDPQEINFDILAAWDLDVKFCLIRSHLGTWPDPYYYALRREAERVGFLVGTWPVLSPYEPTGPQVSAWLNDVPAPGPMGRWIDWEHVGGQTPKKIPSAYQLQRSVEMVEDHDNEPGKVYTRAGLINQYLGSISAAVLNKWFFWYAQYLFAEIIRGEFPPERMSHATRVQPERVLILQTGGKQPPPVGGIRYSKALDRDRWLNVIPLSEFAGGPPTPPPVTLDDRVTILETEARLHGWNV